jgi:hypothetical protein
MATTPVLRGTVVLHRLRPRVRDDEPGEHVADVRRDHPDPVAVVPGQVRGHQVIGHEPRFLVAAAAGPEDGRSDRAQPARTVAHVRSLAFPEMVGCAPNATPGTARRQGDDFA